VIQLSLSGLFPDKPLIFDIARGSFNDGPGIRTTVFFKGCPLHCLWCHNPEAQSPLPDLFFSAADCIHCGNCQAGKSCFTTARREVGRFYPPSELLTLLMTDKAFYEASGGGITLSGGEPLLFIPYLARLLPLLKAEGLHITLQTCGYFAYPEFVAAVLPYIDLIHFDLKVFAPDLHRKYTGLTNEPVLNNLRRLVQERVSILPRIPLVPHYTATPANLTALARLLAELGISACEFLPYNPLGLDKAIRLKRKIPTGLPLSSPLPAVIAAWIALFKEAYAQANASLCRMATKSAGTDCAVVDTSVVDTSALK
jgi:pyruvate formate lyase activating enzyme